MRIYLYRRKGDFHSKHSGIIINRQQRFDGFDCGELLRHNNSVVVAINVIAALWKVICGTRMTPALLRGIQLSPIHGVLSYQFHAFVFSRPPIGLPAQPHIQLDCPIELTTHRKGPPKWKYNGAEMWKWAKRCNFLAIKQRRFNFILSQNGTGRRELPNGGPDKEWYWSVAYLKPKCALISGKLRNRRLNSPFAKCCD